MSKIVNITSREDKDQKLQDIANSLGISRTTVWKVFSGQKGVSDSLRRKILAKAQELGYEFPECAFLPPSPETAAPPVNIAVAVCRPESSIFWMNIIHQIAKELSFHKVNLMYTYLPSAIDRDYTLPDSLVNGNTHGIIVMNVYNEQLIRLLSEAPVPKVFLDTATSVPPSSLNGDLILMENSSSISEITEHLLKQGRTKIGFIGDIRYAQSNYERYEGFCKTLERHGLSPCPELSLTGSIGTDTHKEEIDAFLNTLPLLSFLVLVPDIVNHLSTSGMWYG